MQKQNGRGTGDGGSDDQTVVTIENMREQKAKIDALLQMWPQTDQEILEAIELIKKGMLVWSAWITLNIAEKKKEAERCKS